MLKITRRTFLKATAAGAAIAASGPVFNALRPSKAEAGETGTITMEPTACLGCTTWCAVEAKVQDGRVVDVVGNRHSYSNDGYVCPRAKLAIQQLYDPDRVKVPMVRMNPVKGRGVDPQFVPAGTGEDAWDAAIGTIAQKMIELRYTPDTDFVKYDSSVPGVAVTGSAGSTTLDTDTDVDLTAEGLEGYIIELTDDASETERRMIVSVTYTAGSGSTITIEPALTNGVTSKSFMVYPSQSHKALYLRGRYTDLRVMLYKKIWEIYGTPNKVSHSSICAETEPGVWSNLIGDFSYKDYDLDNCQCLLLWGVDPTSSNRMVPNAIQKIGKRLKNGMKLIVVDPRVSTMGAKAHIHAKINPGTDGALALAIANYILDPTGTGSLSQPTSLLDTVAWGHLNDRTQGLVGSIGDDWWNNELKDRTPAWASAITGIPEATIRKIACMFAGWDYDEMTGEYTTQYRTGHEQCEAISWVGPGICMHPRGLYGGWAAGALNGIIGSFDHLGGVIHKHGSATNPYTSNSVSEGNMLSTSSYKDTLSSAVGAKMLGSNTRTYATLDPNDLTKDYTGSSDPSRPLGMPGFEIKKGDPYGHHVNPTNIVADALRKGYPYGKGDRSKNCKLVIGHFTNFPFSCTGAKRWEDGFSDDGSGKAPFTVSFVTHASEIAMFSDIVLPSDHHMFETYLLTHGQKADFAYIKAMMRPVVPKLWNTKWGATELVWLLGKKMATIGVGSVVSGWPVDYYFTKVADYCDAYGPTLGGSSATDSFTFSKQVLKVVLGDTASSGQLFDNLDTNTDNYSESATSVGVLGTGFGLVQSTIDRSSPGLYFDANGAGPYWLGSAGGGSDYPYTASGRVEFASDNTTPNKSLFQQACETHVDPSHHNTTVDAMMTACNYPTATDSRLYYMPRWVEPSIQSYDPAYEYILVDHKSRFNREGRSANCPMYYEFKSCDPGDEKWQDVIKIHPLDAVAIGVTTGDWVKVSSQYKVNNGTETIDDDIYCRVKVWSGVPKGTVAKCYGQGHWAYGRLAKGRVTSFTDGTSYQGGNNNEILPAEYERLIAANVRNACIAVKIEKVSAPYRTYEPIVQFRGY